MIFKMRSNFEKLFHFNGHSRHLKSPSFIQSCHASPPFSWLQHPRKRPLILIYINLTYISFRSVSRSMAPRSSRCLTAPRQLLANFIRSPPLKQIFIVSSTCCAKLFIFRKMIYVRPFTLVFHSPFSFFTYWFLFLFFIIFSMAV